ncbi:proprotein convertase subtilisin/kexin type 1 inhibitor, like [Phyllopteryx taeniolatus]|uniref:proprotein convertase subtilisin/kexin type 1 inhibitor, like n=1 Tax=Phyllopteryx taeniolatus TaxID=161469 RepID=UPI002AD2BA13|nr:proprotein convertase subtilisin/kexin type 1 inhibitor, like [Phyllopteryx taeniolatus]
MASLSLLVLGTALLHATQCALAAPGGIRRQNLFAYDDDRNEVMSHPAYYQSDGWRGQSLEQALQRLVERGQRQDEEEQRLASVTTLLRLLAKAEAEGLVDPGDVQLEEEDFPGLGQGRALSMGRPPTAWWSLVTPQLLQALLDRMEPQAGGSPPARMILERFQGDDYDYGDDNDVRRLLARILPIISPEYAPSGRARRDVSVTEPATTAYRRSRRSLGDDTLPSRSNEPLLRVKRLGEEEQEGQQLHTMANTNVRQHGGRRRRAALNHVLLHQIANYMRK